MKDFHYFKFKKGEVMMHPYNVEPLDGYIEPKNFPLCCKRHESIYNYSIEYYEKFPFCCEKHSKFLNDFNLKKNQFENIKIDIVRRLSYTEDFIERKINEDNWFEEIVHWLEYIMYSFGNPEVGLSLFNTNLDIFIRKSDKIPESKRVLLIKHIEDLYKDEEEDKYTDFNILIDTYKRWLKLFPFELSVFSKLKEHFNKTLPFVKEKPDYNPYTGLTKFKVVNQKELINNLIGLTNNILSQVDTTILTKQDNSNLINGHSLEITNKLHKTKQETLLKQFSKEENKYLRTIKKWLENEKEYFKDITIILNQKSLPEPTKTTISKYLLLSNTATRHHTSNQLTKALIDSKYISENSKADLINAFNGNAPQTKVNWLGQKGDLYSFIKYCNENKIFHNNIDIWVESSKVFNIKGVSYTSNQLKDSKRTKNDYSLKKLVKNNI